MPPTALSPKVSLQAPSTQPSPSSLRPQPAPKRVSLGKVATIPNQQKKVTHRSSKPIINWLQRKLGTRRADAQASKPPIPLRVTNRVTSSPLPSPPVNGGRQQSRLDALAVSGRKTISLNDGDEDNRRYSHSDEGSTDGSSLAPDSTWSPTSEADEDASVRPLPPSAPPSPSPSRSSSSYLSDPRTFRSIAASTKPTTLLSVDVPAGVAHIAQAPPTPTSATHRYPAHHVRTSSNTTNQNVVGSGASITFSALPPSPQSSRAPSFQNPAGSSTTSPSAGPVASVQAPLHTSHHPRNNPRPSSPPPDNASVLTLASSAYALPGNRVGSSTPGAWSSAPPSAAGGDSVSHFDSGALYADAESTSQFVAGDDTDEVDASVRALRPRSSRRGSWESEVSRWSAKDPNGPGTPSLTWERSLRTANSVKTSAFSMDEADLQRGESDNALTGSQFPLEDGQTALEISVLSPSAVSDTEPTPKNTLQSIHGQLIEHSQVEGQPTTASDKLTDVQEEEPLVINQFDDAVEDQKEEGQTPHEEKSGLTPTKP